MKTFVAALSAACAFAACAPTSGAPESRAPESQEAALVAAATEAAIKSGAALTPSAVIIRPRVQQSYPVCDRRHVMALGTYPDVDTGVASCPAPGGGWVGRNVFGTTSAPMSSRTLVQNRAMCEYTLSPALPFTTVGLPVVTDLWADCPVITPLSSQGDDALLVAADEFLGRYDRQIEQVPALPVVNGLLATSFPQAGVRVAILDSLNDTGQPESPKEAARAEHGRAVMSTISRIVCPDGGKFGPCPVELRTYQVFDLADGGAQWLADEKAHVNPDPVRRMSPGGFLLQLASKIEQAVNDAATGTPKRLIINLSVGYHAQYSGLAWQDDVWAWQRGTEAIIAALDHAACSGALVIAAIGNREDGTEPWRRAMFPAWLDGGMASCGGRPLLYSASGLNPQDKPVGNAIDSRYSPNPVLESPFAAPGFAVASEARGGTAVPLMTGSSFGAAGVSAVAALVWSYRPGLTPLQVMQAVYNSAVSTGREPNERPAAFGLDVPTVRRVSACRAVNASVQAICRRRRCSMLDCDALAAGHGTDPELAQTLLDMVAEDRRFAPTFAPVAATFCTYPQGTDVRTADSNDPSLHMCPWTRTNVLAAPINPDATPPQAVLYTEPPQAPCRPCIVVKGDPEPGDEQDGGVALLAAPAPTPKNYLIVGLDPSYDGVLSSPTLRVGNRVLALGNRWVPAAQEGLVAVELPEDVSGDAYSLTFLKTDDQTSITSYVPQL